MKNENLLKLINDIFGNDNKSEECDCCDCCCDCCCGCDDNLEKLDLTKDEDYAKFNDYVDECNKICESDEVSSNITKMLFDALFGADFKDVINEIKQTGDKIHSEAKSKEHKTPELPSSKTPTDKKLQIHKLVAEYVDTIIRPNTEMDRNVIDDVYAGLFEFACWLMNK